MTTDTGVDLVAYWDGVATTVQVKTAAKFRPSGGKGKPSSSWWVSDSKHVDYVSFALLEELRIWVLSWRDVRSMAVQHPPGRYHLGFYRDPNVRTREVRRLPGSWDRFEGRFGIDALKEGVQSRRRSGGSRR